MRGGCYRPPAMRVSELIRELRRRVRRASGMATGRFLSIVLAGALLAGCLPDRGGQPTQVSQAWQQAQEREPAPVQSQVSPSPALPASDHEPIAAVNGRPISRERLLGLLLAGRGAEVLDELIVMELVRQQAAERGITVTAREVEAEYERSLRIMLSTLTAGEPDTIERETAERVLDEVLVARGISEEEYRLGVTRNAYLRKLATDGLSLTEAELRDEMSRAFGERVRVRHIQLGSLADAERVARRLEDGADFAEMARQHSANRVTGPAGGILDSFSRNEPDVPALLREAAFGLAVGAVSSPIRQDAWYHIIRVEERLAGEDVVFEEVRPQLEKRVTERRVGAEMQRISAELFESANITVRDKVLEAEFLDRHPGRGRSGR